MKLVSFILNYSKTGFAACIGLGLASGACISTILVLVHQRLSATGPTPGLLAAGFFGAIALYAITNTLNQASLVNISLKATQKLQHTICNQILKLPLAKIEKMGAPKIMASLTEDVHKIQIAIEFLPSTVVNLSIVLGCSVYLAILSPRLYAIVIGIFIVGLISILFIFPIAQRYIDRGRGDASRVFEQFRFVAEGHKELLINSQKKTTFLNQHLETTLNKVRKNTTIGKSILTGIDRWGESLILASLGAILFGLSYGSGIPKTTLSGFILTGLFMATPLSGLLNYLPKLSQSNVAIAHIEDLGIGLRPDTDTPETTTPQLDLSPQNTLSLSKLSYDYPSESNAFHFGDVSFEAKSGEITFIAGGNGSGKTTLLKLLTGLYSPSSGTIAWNNIEINASNNSRYRELFSVIFFDFFLFDHVLTESPSVSSAQSQFLEKMDLSSKVHISDNQFSTTDLSQGQRRRLSLLSALLEDKPVYVFDEWAADQDPEFKKYFYETILSDLKKQNKIVIAITHDDHYFHIADQLITLQGGKIKQPARRQSSSRTAS